MFFFLKEKKYKDRGSTLVELVVSMALTAILATAVATVMHPAISIFLKVQKMNRAQMVADTITDTLRTECAASYIRNYGDVRVVNVEEGDYASGDDKIVDELNGVSGIGETNGNTLLIRKNDGYAEAVYWNSWISAKDHDEVLASDDSESGPSRSNITSRAVYRLFPEGTSLLKAANMPAETKPGYMHLAYYEIASSVTDIDGKSVSEIRPVRAYDYTNPFSVNVYGGFTAAVTYSDLTYDSVVPGSASLADMRPAYVVATIKIYDSDYEGQSYDNLLYSRQAVLCFAKDNMKE
ncbi:MAG: type II secretion system GspH family protein [Lachnospiraceae bacterium]|nr:type II secretion system GspH family protein [Lachnospiraceae bacterium]